jgi:hypothetical protein
VRDLDQRERRAQITNNTVIGLGATALSWQNGIWIANGSQATITGNVISNIRTPLPMRHTPAVEDSGRAWSGIMVAGGSTHNSMPHYTIGIRISGNRLVDNDIGVLLSNSDTGVAPKRRIDNRVTGNTIRIKSSLIAPGSGIATAAGIKDEGGNGDQITGNSIAGYGKTAIVTSLSINVVVADNHLS